MATALLTFFCWFCFALTEARAEAAPLPLEQAIGLAEAKSPDIQQLENQADSAAAKKRLALSPGEPTLSVSFNDMLSPLSFGSTSSEVFQLTQPVGFPGRAFVNRSLLRDQEDALHYQVRALKLQVSLSVKQAYYAVQLAQENMRLNHDTRLSYEQILGTAKRRYESGQTSQVDYLNAQVQLLSNQNDLIDLQNNEKNARAQLNLLLRNPIDAPLEVAPIQMLDHPRIELSQAIEQMLSSRNEIKSAQLQSDASGKAYQLAWLSLLPDFQLVAGTTYYRQPFSSPLSSVPAYQNVNFPTHTFMVGLQFSIPIWGLLNEREVIVGASHDRAAAEANLDVVYNQSKAAMEAAIDTSNALRVKIENFEKHLLPLSEQALKIAMASYSAGKVDFQTLSDTAAARRQVRLNYATAVTSYLTNYSIYGQLIGEDL